MVGILAGVNVAAGSNDTTNTSDKRERSKRSLPFFIPNPTVEKVHAIFRMNKPVWSKTQARCFSRMYNGLTIG